VKLGLFFQAKGDIVAAEEMFDRSLIIREKTLGLENLLVAEVHVNLQKFLKDKKGDTIGAKQNFQRSIQIRETVFGPEHKETNKVQKLLKECAASEEVAPAANAQEIDTEVVGEVPQSIASQGSGKCCVVC